MSRRPASTSRRFTDGGSIPFVGSFHPKSRPSPVVSIGLVVVGAFLIVGYLYSGSGGSNADKEALMKLEGKQVRFRPTSSRPPSIQEA